jgi:hypothetical protein
MLTVGDYMTRHPHTIGHAVKLGFVPVCDADCRVLGTLTDRDLTTRVQPGRSL